MSHWSSLYIILSKKAYDTNPPIIANPLPLKSLKMTQILNEFRLKTEKCLVIEKSKLHKNRSDLRSLIKRKKNTLILYDCIISVFCKLPVSLNTVVYIFVIKDLLKMTYKTN